MSQHASSSSQTHSSRSIRRGEAAYTIPEGFPATSVQSALKVVRQYRRSEVSKGEAIFQIQSSLSSGEAEPSKEDLTSSLTTYITMLDDLDRPARENQPGGPSEGGSTSRAPKLFGAPIQPGSDLTPSEPDRAQEEPGIGLYDAS